MGGHNSTRWEGVATRVCVESCFTVCAPRGRLVMGRSLVLKWPRERVTVHCEVLAGSSLLLRHDFGGGGSQTVRLVQTAANLGGSRWWFLCPGCGSRVGRLHLPGRGRILPLFKCRACHGLTYESAKSSRTWIRSIWLSYAAEWGCSYREARDAARASNGGYLYEPRRLVFGGTS
jgi:hypothetical protein